MRKRELFAIFTFCCVVGAASCIMTATIYENKMKSFYSANAAQTQLEEQTIAASVDTGRITPSTKMVYEYYYTEDGVTQTLEDVPPYFLLDMTLEDMKKVYTDWQIVSFSSKEVVMRKTVEAKSNEQYIIGEQNGYVAVFYKEPQHGIILHEITNTPLSALPLEERERLQEGISVIGDENLSKILSDYTS